MPLIGVRPEFKKACKMPLKGAVYTAKSLQIGLVKTTGCFFMSENTTLSTAPRRSP